MSLGSALSSVCGVVGDGEFVELLALERGGGVDMVAGDKPESLV